VADIVKPGAVRGDRASGGCDAEERSPPWNKSKAAVRQARYRARKRNAAVTPLAVTPSPSPVSAVTAALSDLVDMIECVTPAEVAEMLDDITALGVAGDAKIASAWLSALEFLAAPRAGR